MTAILWIAMVTAFGVSVLAGHGTIPSFEYFPTEKVAAFVGLAILAHEIYTVRQYNKRRRAAERAARDQAQPIESKKSDNG